MKVVEALKVVEDFEAAVRDHEMRGARHPLDHQAIEEEYKRAKEALLHQLMEKRRKP
jgi:hypothetical protein